MLDNVFAQTSRVREMLDKMATGAEKKLDMPKGNAQTRTRAEVLIAGKYHILLTNDEAAGLVLLARKYADQRGSYMGFISHIIQRIQANRDRLQLSDSGAQGG